MTAIDPARCPLCDRPNACAIVSGKGVCWCFAIKIPDALLARVPPDARDRACICERCATASRPHA